MRRPTGSRNEGSRAVLQPAVTKGKGARPLFPRSRASTRLVIHNRRARPEDPAPWMAGSSAAMTRTTAPGLLLPSWSGSDPTIQTLTRHARPPLRDPRARPADPASGRPALRPAMTDGRCHPRPPSRGSGLYSVIHGLDPGIHSFGTSHPCSVRADFMRGAVGEAGASPCSPDLPIGALGSSGVPKSTTRRVVTGPRACTRANITRARRVSSRRLSQGCAAFVSVPTSTRSPGRTARRA